MSDVIVFASSKGGAGKTTSAVLLATELSAINQRVVIVDADENKPLLKWANRGSHDGIEVVGASENDIIEVIASAKSRADFVIVDLEGSKNLCVSYAIGCADMVVVPSKPSTLDIDESAATVKLIKNQEKLIGRDILYRLLLTQTAAAIESNTTKNIKADIERHNIKRLTVEVIDRDPFKEMFTVGCGLRTLLANATTKKNIEKYQKAIANAEAFAVEVVKTLKSKQKTGVAA